jgi:Fe-S-cluster-containing dehydrogenase component
MTSLPADRGPRRLGLVIDLDTCVGCHACAVACKEWNDGGVVGPLTDYDPTGAHPDGVWLNRVHGFEATFAPDDGGEPHRRTVYFPRSCLHCEDAACVTVCPTGASYKRAEDGIVLVDEDKCIGCKLCSWACPYGAREYDRDSGVMKKCTLCIDRIYNRTLPEAERVPACVTTCPTSARHFGDLADPGSEVAQLVARRGGAELMPELGYRPTNRYLPPRPQRAGEAGARALTPTGEPEGKFGQWADRLFSR